MSGTERVCICMRILLRKLHDCVCMWFLPLIHIEILYHASAVISRSKREQLETLVLCSRFSEHCKILSAGTELFFFFLCYFFFAFSMRLARAIVDGYENSFLSVRLGFWLWCWLLFCHFVASNRVLMCASWKCHRRDAVKLRNLINEKRTYKMMKKWRNETPFRTAKIDKERRRISGAFSH